MSGSHEDRMSLLRLFCLTAVVLLVAAPATDGKPIGLILDRVSEYRADAIWFFPGINDSTLAYDDGDWDVGVGVCDVDMDNRVAVKFADFSAPTFIREGSVFILSLDPDPSLPGDPLSPVEMSLHSDDEGRPGDVVSGPYVIQATGLWENGGEWVSASFDYLHESESPLWLQVRWPSSSPFMPRIGADAEDLDFQSWAGYSSGGVDNWQQFPDYDLMMRLDVLLSTRQFPIEVETDIDSFAIYSRDRLPLELSPANLHSITLGSVLHERVHVESPDNYFCVTSWRRGIEGPPSDIVHMTSSGGSAPPVSITPIHFESFVSVGRDSTGAVRIRNNGFTVVEYEFQLIDSDPFGSDDIPMALKNSSGCLFPGQTDSVVLEIHSAGLEIGEYWEMAVIEFRDSIEVFLPRDVSIHVIVDEQTAASDEHTLIPPQCMLLLQNHPNPFNCETTIHVENVARGEDFILRIVNVLGQTVRELMPLETSGSNLTFSWDGKSSSGCPCNSGVYFYTVSGRNGEWKKMLLIK